MGLAHVAQGSSFSYGAWFAIVGVQPEFGLVGVRRLAGALAAGRILNEKTAASQMRGGAVMGIGQALLEATTTDRETARILNPGLNEYLIPIHAASRRSTLPSSKSETRTSTSSESKASASYPCRESPRRSPTRSTTQQAGASAISRSAPRCCCDAA
jgi:CO/xanthine dehydrogenase Mo-binding subunit